MSSRFLRPFPMTSMPSVGGRRGMPAWLCGARNGGSPVPEPCIHFEHSRELRSGLRVAHAFRRRSDLLAPRTLPRSRLAFQHLDLRRSPCRSPHGAIHPPSSAFVSSPRSGAAVHRIRAFTSEVTAVSSWVLCIEPYCCVHVCPSSIQRQLRRCFQVAACTKRSGAGVNPFDIK